MSIATLTEYKAQQNITDTADDALIQWALDAATENLESELGYTVNQATETRVFTASEGSYLCLDRPMVSVTSVKTDTNHDGTYDRTWGSGDYELHPWNYAADNEPVWEIRVAEATDSTGYTFPTWQRGVQVVGVFGLPYDGKRYKALKGLCLFEATRAFQAMQSPSGVTFNEALGEAVFAPPLHPMTRRQVKKMARPYVGSF